MKKINLSCNKRDLPYLATALEVIFGENTKISEMTNEVEWCGFHNIPMRICYETSSGRCKVITIPLERVIDIVITENKKEWKKQFKKEE